MFADGVNERAQYYICVSAFLVPVGWCLPILPPAASCIKLIHTCISLDLLKPSLWLAQFSPQAWLWRRLCQKWVRKSRNEWPRRKKSKKSHYPEHIFPTSDILVNATKRSCYLSVIVENLITISVWQGNPVPTHWSRHSPTTPPSGCVQQRGPSGQEWEAADPASPAARLIGTPATELFLGHCPHQVQLKLPFSAAGAVLMSKEWKVTVWS